MLKIRRAVPLSWFDPDGSRILSRKLRERLEKRMRKGGLFLTLTYNREEWPDARELYEAAKREQHFNRFMQRLQKLLGASLRGLWIRKIEFQASGHVHHHVLIDWRSRIPHSVLEKAWGHGFVWVSKASARRIRYFSKYLAKCGEDFPRWLLVEPSRSIRLVACSPGFWSDGADDAEDDHSAPVNASKILEELLRLSSGPPAGKLPAYVPLGEVLSRSRDVVEVWYRAPDLWPDDPPNEFVLECRVKLPLDYALSIITGCGGVVVPGDDPRFIYLAVDDLADVLDELVERESVRAADGASRPSPHLHLTTTSELTTPAPWMLEFWLESGDLISERRAA